MERVIVFIDGSNFYHGLQGTAYSKKRVDFQRFSDLFSTPTRRVVRTNYYNVRMNQWPDKMAYAGQQSFLSQIDKIRHFEVTLGRLVDRNRTETCPNCSQQFDVAFQVEKGVDIFIAVDMLAGAFDNQYDTAVLVSNDGDFVPAVGEVLRLHKSVLNAEFPMRLPSHLSRKCSDVVPLTEAFLKPSLY